MDIKYAINNMFDKNVYLFRKLLYTKKNLNSGGRINELSGRQ